MLSAVFEMSPEAKKKVYDGAPIARLERVLVFSGPHVTAEVLVTGWGCPKLDSAFLDQHPKLRLVLYGAGTIKGVVTPEFWKRGITITSAWTANAIPVAEFALAAIILSLKQALPLAVEMRETKSFPRGRPILGEYGATVGLISLGAIGRLVAERLRRLDLNVIAYDPFADAQQAADLGVTMVDLETLFQKAEVVSLHTPWLPETEGMIRGAHLRSMKPYSAFINTARGAVVNEPEMIEALRDRPDLHAILDVTWPEPPAADSPLYSLKNVTLTPHIAGAQGRECQRMGLLMAEELERYVAGQPLHYQVTESMCRTMA